ncbi:hypothetical protein HPP92_013889 [Vanilla planifolia]|uniref:Uncharacterized protein n=1 Tax=Vanilla planifolia TaxID=51239 RepID=A0A835QZ41_VANPL|nr:hypothetical protein HPP92_013889 [Vanilla planifolia]
MAQPFRDDGWRISNSPSSGSGVHVGDGIVAEGGADRGDDERGRVVVVLRRSDAFDEGTHDSGDRSGINGKRNDEDFLGLGEDGGRGGGAAGREMQELTRFASLGSGVEFLSTSTASSYNGAC